MKICPMAASRMAEQNMGSYSSQASITTFGISRIMSSVPTSYMTTRLPEPLRQWCQSAWPLPQQLAPRWDRSLPQTRPPQAMQLPLRNLSMASYPSTKDHGSSSSKSPSGQVQVNMVATLRRFSLLFRPLSQPVAGYLEDPLSPCSSCV